MNANTIIELLGLRAHPEGGFFRETFRDAELPEERGLSTAIYYMLRSGERSHWHRVDAAEVWHFYYGAPLILSLAEHEHAAPKQHVLGNNLGLGERPQVVVPTAVWQSAESLGDFTLVGCTVAPGFDFDGFELAPEGFSPRRHQKD